MRVQLLNPELLAAYPGKVAEILGRHAEKCDIAAIIDLLHGSTKEKQFTDALRPLLAKAGLKGGNFNRLKNQLWAIAPNNKKFQRKLEQDPGVLLASPRISFPGTDFSLSTVTGRRPQETLNHFRNLRALNDFDKTLIPKALADSDEERRKVYENFSQMMAAAIRDPELINPHSEKFEIVAWYSFVYLEAATKLTEAGKVENGVQLVKLGAVKDYFKTLSESLDEDWDKALQYLESLPQTDNDYIKLEQIQNALGLEQNLALKARGLFIAPGTDGLPYEGKIVWDLAREVMSKSGLRIPVDYVYALNSGELGAGYCDHSRVLLSIDALIQVDSVVKMSQVWFDDFTKNEATKPKFVQVPKLLFNWLSAMSIGATSELGRAEIQQLFEEHVLAEELAHAETSAYAEVKMRREGYDMYGAAEDRDLPYLAYSIMRPGSEVFKTFDEQLKDQNVQTRKEAAKAAWEVEANLKSIAEGPLPLLNLQEYLGGVAFSMGMDSTDREAYDAAKIINTKLLTEELIPGGKELTAELDWSELMARRKLDSNGKLTAIRTAWAKFFDDNFATVKDATDSAKLQQIRNAAQRVLDREFYTDAERETMVPGWKEEHNSQ
ncbi:MAG: hypothetical protein OXU45_02680 [Candidatus Melainabacteria bacterium]|nr:hypothetical protein [Candidatus Melainabacteria bacterium]